jgi:ABC-type multidrug transport system ATPase subunit
MEGIRRILGVCPQHDILFDTLTVREHLQFYGALKGVPQHELDDAVREKLREVDLLDKIDTRVETLSGGQKRKLSVAMAFIGQSRVVFLDEPTSGIDPLSRRRVWDVIQRYKHGRVIILTTHHMDEADLLGDRIAIFANGKLKCQGTSLSLKNKFGIGYHLDMVRSSLCDTHDLQTIIDLVHHHVQGATRIVKSSPLELSFALPLSQIQHFAPLLRTLEQDSHTLKIESYGMSMTSLEEVFLNIANNRIADTIPSSSTSSTTLANALTNANASHNNDSKHATTEAKSHDGDTKEHKVDLHRSPLSPNPNERHNHNGDDDEVEEDRLIAASSSVDDSSLINMDLNSPLAPTSDNNTIGHDGTLSSRPTFTNTGTGTGNNGRASWQRQMVAMIYKRQLVSRRDSRSLTMQLILPFIYVIFFIVVTNRSSEWFAT